MIFSQPAKVEMKGFEISDLGKTLLNFILR